jgi:hypothetical protein
MLILPYWWFKDVTSQAGCVRCYRVGQGVVSNRKLYNHVIYSLKVAFLADMAAFVD